MCIKSREDYKVSRGNLPVAIFPETMKIIKFCCSFFFFNEIIFFFFDFKTIKIFIRFRLKMHKKTIQIKITKSGFNVSHNVETCYANFEVFFFYVSVKIVLILFFFSNFEFRNYSKRYLTRRNDRNRGVRFVIVPTIIAT